MLTSPRWQSWSIMAFCLLSLLAALPNALPQSVLDRLPVWYAASRINLGLDLRGGAHFLLEVDVQGVFRDRASALADQVRGSLRQNNIQIAGDRVDGLSVTVTLRNETDRAKAVELIRALDADLRVDAPAGGPIRMTFTEQAVVRKRQQVLEQSIEILRRRIDETGTIEPNIQRQGDERILVQVPGIKDTSDLKRKINQTAKLAFQMIDEDTPPSSAAIPPRSYKLPSPEGYAQALRQYMEAGPDRRPEDLKAETVCTRFQVECYVVLRRIHVAGEELTDAQATFDQQTGRPIVSFAFTNVGARQFCTVSSANVGKRLAIVLDGKVISAPVLQGAICQGRGIITGQFTSQQTNELALLLRSGALPATLTIIEERTVGADLGADAIRAGTIAALIGTALVVLFMFLAYGPLFGSLANLAMAVNVLMVFAGMSLLGSSLTLPGIAGILLTVGMAVDANVLIYERVREEQAAGRSPISALTAGYERALSAIIDANITTLIAGLLMFGFGSGPIRGFAITLSLGLLTSMFSSTLFTRMLLAWWLQRRRPTELVI